MEDGNLEDDGEGRTGPGTQCPGLVQSHRRTTTEARLGPGAHYPGLVGRALEDDLEDDNLEDDGGEGRTGPETQCPGLVQSHRRTTAEA